KLVQGWLGGGSGHPRVTSGGRDSDRVQAMSADRHGTCAGGSAQIGTISHVVECAVFDLSHCQVTLCDRHTACRYNIDVPIRRRFPRMYLWIQRLRATRVLMTYLITNK